MKTVIYHSADADGWFCREIARKFLGPQNPNEESDVVYIGWNFGDAKIPVPLEGEIYVLDLSLDCFDTPYGFLIRSIQERIVWIDHHKTSIDKWPSDIPGYRIDGVAACRLVWQWFSLYHDGTAGPKPYLPSKQDFIDRKVLEPLAVRLAGEYDVWDKRDPDAERFQYGLRSVDLEGDKWWPHLLKNDALSAVDTLLSNGKIAQSYALKIDASICNSLTWIMEWEGLKWLCVNHARFNSLLFAAKDSPETGHDALLGFRFDGKSWMVSLYHSKHRTDLDLSQIAVKHGGGGHRGACGFTCKQLPFTL